MKINKSQLQEALEIVKPGLANKELIEQSTSFAFLNGAVKTYNDEISVSHPVEGLELEGAILADNLYKFLGRLKEEELDLRVNGNELILTTGKAKAGLTLMSEVKLPFDEELNEKGKWLTLPDNFCENIAFVMTAAGTNLSQPMLTCVHVNKEGFVEASDGYRLARYTLVNEMPVNTFLIPARSVVEVVKLDPKPTRISVGKGWVHFRNKSGTIMSCRVYHQDSYKDMSAFLELKGTRITLPDDIPDMLNRAVVFAKRDHILEEKVYISINSERLRMRASSDSGWFKEESDMKSFKGDPISFTITPYLLKGILAETGGCEVTNNRIKFQGENWVYISALSSDKDKEKK
jgi:hypothetical protein